MTTLANRLEAMCVCTVNLLSTAVATIGLTAGSTNLKDELAEWCLKIHSHRRNWSDLNWTSQYRSVQFYCWDVNGSSLKLLIHHTTRSCCAVSRKLTDHHMRRWYLYRHKQQERIEMVKGNQAPWPKDDPKFNKNVHILKPKWSWDCNILIRNFPRGTLQTSWWSLNNFLFCCPQNARFAPVLIVIGIWYYSWIRLI